MGHGPYTTKIKVGDKMTEKILDLFAGVSGLSLGLELFKDSKGGPIFEVYKSVEIDKYACETLRNLHGADKVIEGDLTNKEIHKEVIASCKGKVSIVVGGIPCQSFSLIGARSGDKTRKDKFKQDARDNLYQEYFSIVKEIKPKIIVIENVKGILSKKDKTGKKIIDTLISDFESIGYSFDYKDHDEKYRLVNSADFGVPQKRERVIIIGINKNWKDTSIPWIERTHKDPCEDFKELKNHVNLFDAIGNLPSIQSKITTTGLFGKKVEEINKKNTRINNGGELIVLKNEDIKSHLNKISESGKEFQKFVLSKDKKIINHIARNHQLSDIQLFKEMNQGETAGDFITRSPNKAQKLIKYKMHSFKDKYRKQSYKLPCTTVFAHLQKDGNRFIHPTQARTISVREAARIQSFPDWIKFSGPLSQQYKQIGNAVPPLLSKNYIAQALYDLIRGKNGIK